MDNNRLFVLLDKYQEGTCSKQEWQELEVWYNSLSTRNEPLLFTDESAEEMLLQFRQRLADQPVIPAVKRFRIGRMAVAAALLMVVGSIAYFAFFKKTTQEPIAINQKQADIPAPGKNRATIILADGRTVYLDGVANGQLAIQQHVKLVKRADGSITYLNDSQQPIASVQYNTLNNPRGSKVIDMTLGDGTHVWLNAGSSITYPVAFVGNERKVSITGEAYFEVAHNAQKPFYVTKREMEVKVLGTHFNVNAYEDEEAIRVTLLEGSVKVSQSTNQLNKPSQPNQPINQSTILKPGEQAALSQQSNPSTPIQVQTADLDQVMAWKNGLFKFDGTNVQAVMRQISKWYDVEVSYPRGIPKDQYWGGIKRDLSLSNVFKILEASGGHFKIEGRKVTVLP